MANLTKEYFDRKIGTLVTKEELKRELKNLVTKDELRNELKNFATKDDFNELAAMINRGFEEIIRKLDVRERVEKLEKKVGRIMEAINLRV